MSPSLLASLLPVIAMSTDASDRFSHILESHGKSWNLRKEFSKPGKSWKMTVVVESHEIPPISYGIFNRRIIIFGV